MKFLFSILFILGICCSQNSFAQTSCTLPAPSNLQVLNQTPTYLLVGWDAVPGAIGYQVECKNTNNVNIPVQSFSTPTSASFIIEPNMSYTVTVKSICSNNEVGGEASELSITPVYLIVVDLLPGYQGDVNTLLSAPVFNPPVLPHDVPVNTLLTPDQCYYYQFMSSGQLVKGIINKENAGRVIWESITQSETSWSLVGITPLDNGFTEFSHQSSSANLPSFLNAVHFYFNGNRQLNIRAFHSAPANISITNFTIWPINCPTGSTKRSSTDIPIENPPIVIAPNPCTDHLNILLPQTPESQVTVKIFDITGKLQQTTSLQPSDITYQSFEVNTNELHPGIYIVQIDNGSKGITTHKVVKI